MLSRFSRSIIPSSGTQQINSASKVPSGERKRKTAAVRSSWSARSSPTQQGRPSRGSTGSAWHLVNSSPCHHRASFSVQQFKEYRSQRPIFRGSVKASW